MFKNVCPFMHTYGIDLLLISSYQHIKLYTYLLCTYINIYIMDLTHIFYSTRDNTLQCTAYYIQPGPSMTFLVYSDPSKTVYSDPPNHFVRITINRFRRITINQERHWWSRLYMASLQFLPFILPWFSAWSYN